MNSIREIIRRFFGEEETGDRMASSPRPDFSYRVYWTKMARSWSADRRRTIRNAVQEVVDDEEFKPNAFERRYQVEALGEGSHAGASLRALLDVIDALQAYEVSEEEQREP